MFQRTKTGTEPQGTTPGNTSLSVELMINAGALKGLFAV